MRKKSLKKRILLSKVGVDVHDRGLKVIAAALRDAALLGTGRGAQLQGRVRGAARALR